MTILSFVQLGTVMTWNMVGDMTHPDAVTFTFRHGLRLLKLATHTRMDSGTLVGAK